jgi:heterotetrameric sarcosine oxidase gamma subunit
MPNIGLKFTRLEPRCLLLVHGSRESIKDMLDLRAYRDDIKHLAAVAGPRAFLLSETDWLLVEHSLQDMRRRFLSAEGGRSQLQLVDVTQSWATLLIEGPRARDALAAATNVPELLKSVEPQQYTGVRLEHVHVIVQCIHAEGFQLYAERHFVSSIQEWLVAAAKGKAIVHRNERLN